MCDDSFYCPFVDTTDCQRKHLKIAWIESDLTANYLKILLWGNLMHGT